MVAIDASVHSATVKQIQAEVDLIHESDISVNVSQRGAKGLVEFLVDGHENTVWEPGRAKSSVITLKLQPAAHAHRCDIAFKRVGREYKKACEARITANHNEVERFLVDPDVQPHHDITLTGEGEQSLALEFASMGKPQGCRYFGVAEIVLTGTLGDGERLAYAFPQVLIGSEQPNFDEQPKTLKPIWKAAPFVTLKALCEAQTKLTAKAASQADPGDPYPPTSYCTDKGLIKPTKGELEAPFQHVHRVRVGEANSNSPELFFVQTTRGWYPANVVLAPGITNDLGGAYSKTEVDSLETRDGRLWIELTRHEALVGAFNDPYDVTGRLIVVCTLSERLDCRLGVTAFGTVGKSWATALYMQSGKVPFHPTQWRWTRNASVTSSGSLRFSQCEDASGSSVVCEANDAERLFPH